MKPNGGEKGRNIEKIEAGTEGFAEVETWNAVDDHLEHSDGDELGDDGEEAGEESGEEALDDGDQLRGPHTGQGGQGEARAGAEDEEEGRVTRPWPWLAKLSTSVIPG